jgi:hypothetical protein
MQERGISPMEILGDLFRGILPATGHCRCGNLTGMRVKNSYRWMAALAVLAVVALMPGPAAAAEGWDMSLGIRGGMSSRSGEDFQQYDAVAGWIAPWRAKEYSGMALGIDLAAGILMGEEENGAVVSLGPTLILGKPDWIFRLKLGISPTFISRYEFERTHFGGPIQFISSVSLILRPKGNLDVGFRVQHMSNASIYENNPGLNLFMLELGVRF